MISDNNNNNNNNGILNKNSSVSCYKLLIIFQEL